jgi:putative flippase GtrA
MIACSGRVGRGGRVVDYPVLKLVLNRLGNRFIQLLFRIPCDNISNAFKMYRRTAIGGIQPLLAQHVNLTVELPLKSIVRGYRYAIVPNTWINRRQATSKFKVKEMGSRYFFIVLYCFLENSPGARGFQELSGNPRDTASGMALVIPGPGDPAAAFRGERRLGCASASNGTAPAEALFHYWRICFCIDVGGFVALRLLKLPILPASVLSFVTATLCSFVFRSGRFSRPEEIVRLFIIALLGLKLNTAVVWLLAQSFRLDLTLANILGVFPVFVWNYLGRRGVVFDGSPPAAVALLAERVRGRLPS